MANFQRYRDRQPKRLDADTLNDVDGIEISRPQVLLHKLFDLGRLAHVQSALSHGTWNDTLHRTAVL